jgi:hypothetical protein
MRQLLFGKLPLTENSTESTPNIAKETDGDWRWISDREEGGRQRSARDGLSVHVSLLDVSLLPAGQVNINLRLEC